MDHKAVIRSLKNRKAWLEASLNKIERTLDTEPSKDFEDRATEREDDEVLEHLGKSELIELKQVIAALERVKAGTFGVCVACGDTVSEDRLTVIPHAARCRKCA